MHLHTDYGIAVSAQQNGLLPISQQSLFVLASLGYHDYEGLALNDEEKPRLVADLGKKTFLILRNHGLLTVGPTVADAFLSMFLLERACRIQILAQSGGREAGADRREDLCANSRAGSGCYARWWWTFGLARIVAEAGSDGREL